MSYLKRISFCFCICSLPAPLLADTVFDASFRILRFDYEEFDQSGATFNKETGVIPGFSLSFSKTLKSYTSEIGFEAYGGEVDYDGQTQSGTPIKSDTDETINRLFYKLNWSAEQSNSAIYGKITWQLWDRDILPVGNVSGLYEQYEWLTFEVGLLATLAESDSAKWLLELGVLKTDSGTMKVDLNNQGFGQPELALGDGTGASIALLYQHRLTNRNKISLSLQHQRWTFGRSNTEVISNGISSYDIYEPRSVSNHSILSLNYGHSF